jgi:pimeloyl-ACP methyl ester carboxylesterase
MPIVDLNGKRISYWSGRKSLLERREVVLFIHGAGGGQYTWSYQKGFFEKSFNPVIIELPGHGESGGQGEEEIGRYAEHVHSFMKIRGLTKVFLVGHSMGGAITQTVALKHPEAIKGIILVGTGARLRVLPLILNGIKSDFEATIREIVKFSYSRKAPRDSIERGVSDLMRCQPEVLLGDFLACDRFDMMNEVGKIDLPTLILCGNEDQLTPVKYSEFLQSRIKGSNLEILPDAGHMVMMEAAKAFNEKIGEFISKMPSERTS